MHDFLLETSIATLQARMESGESSHAGNRRGLRGAHVRAIDPILHSVEINPDTLEIAASLDVERREKEPRGRSTASLFCSKTTSTPATRCRPQLVPWRSSARTRPGIPPRLPVCTLRGQ